MLGLCTAILHEERVKSVCWSFDVLHSVARGHCGNSPYESTNALKYAKVLYFLPRAPLGELTASLQALGVP